MLVGKLSCSEPHREPGNTVALPESMKRSGREQWSEMSVDDDSE